MPRINVKDKRKQQLIEANIVSIARRGLTDTTIAHVSKGAGMSRGIVNFYFTSKEKMMQETLQFMADEFTQAWQETLKSERAKGSETIAIAEAILRTLMHDRLCSAKRMAVWAAFLGHASSHMPFARIIRAMDEALTAQLRKLWQEAGYDAHEATIHARQLEALIRGHWLMSALSEEEKRPSAYVDAWIEVLSGDSAPQTSEPEEKVVQLKPAAPKRQEGQRDLNELFAIDEALS